MTQGTVPVLYQFIIHRKSHVIQTPIPDPGKIVLLDELLVSGLCMIALGKPAAEIDTMLITTQEFHKSVPPLNIASSE